MVVTTVVVRSRCCRGFADRYGLDKIGKVLFCALRRENEDLFAFGPYFEGLFLGLKNFAFLTLARGAVVGDTCLIHGDQVIGLAVFEANHAQLGAVVVEGDAPHRRSAVSSCCWDMSQRARHPGAGVGGCAARRARSSRVCRISSP